MQCDGARKAFLGVGSASHLGEAAACRMRSWWCRRPTLLRLLLSGRQGLRDDRLSPLPPAAILPLPPAAILPLPPAAILLLPPLLLLALSPSLVVAFVILIAVALAAMAIPSVVGLQFLLVSLLAAIVRAGACVASVVVLSS